MNTQTLNLSGGYTAVIATDEGPENPWEAWDCQPPIMAYNLNNRSVSDYNTGLSIRAIYDLIPLSAFADGAGEVMKALDVSECDFYCSPQNTEEWRDAIRDVLPDSPGYWGEAEIYFEQCESLCKLAGIACLNGHLNGYCQGDSALVFIAAMPDWLKETGIAAENVGKALQSDLKLWGAWAWGDVYGIVSIHRPDGEEIEDGSAWGFYGADHKESGLLEAAEDAAEGDRQDLARQAEADRLFQEREDAESFRAACADILTV